MVVDMTLVATLPCRFNWEISIKRTSSDSVAVLHELKSLGEIDIPEEKQERWEDAAEVVVPLDGRRGIEGEGAEQLHAHDGVDEEEHAHQ